MVLRMVSHYEQNVNCLRNMELLNIAHDERGGEDALAVLMVLIMAFIMASGRAEKVGFRTAQPSLKCRFDSL